MLKLIKECNKKICYAVLSWKGLHVFDYKIQKHKSLSKVDNKLLLKQDWENVVNKRQIILI